MKKILILIVIFIFSFALLNVVEANKKESTTQIKDIPKEELNLIEREINNIEGEAYDKEQIYFKDIEPLYRIFSFKEADFILENIEKIFRKEKPNEFTYVFSEIEELDLIVTTKIKIGSDIYSVTICKEKGTISYKKM